MNTIQLQRTVTIQTFDAPAVIAIGRRRPEWLAFAQLAKDFDGEISAEQITQELLSGVPLVVGRRVIQRCVALGLLEQSSEERKAGIARLSNLGEVALATGQVFVPEERNWRFYFAEDPLLEQPLLHVEPLETGSAQSDRSSAREARKLGHGRPDDGDKSPNYLNDAEAAGCVIHSIVEQSPSFVLTAAPQRGMWADSQSLQLHLLWENGGQPTVCLLGSIIPPPRRAEKGEKPTPSQPQSVNWKLPIPDAFSHIKHEELMMELAASGIGTDVETIQDWLQRAGRLVVPTSFSICKPAARNSFREDVVVPEILSGMPGAISQLGPFDPSKLTEVELVPSTNEDAQQWADWKLHDSLTEYSTSSDLQRITEATRKLFPFHTPSLPSPEDMLKAALANPNDAKSRFILAPYDLGLWS